MYAFDYKRATDLNEAVSALADDDQAQALAGGMTLIPALKHRLANPSRLVDIGRLAQLRGIALEGERVRIGAATPHQQVADDPVVNRAVPGLAQLAGLIGDPQVRACGTLGGSVANNDPAADYPAAVLALDGRVVTSTREIEAQAFFLGMFATALASGELITAISFRAARRSAYAKFRHPASGYAMAGVFVADLGADGLRVAVIGVAGGVFRWHHAEQAWAAGTAAPALSRDDILDDIHAPARYRAHLAGVLLEDALAQLAA